MIDPEARKKVDVLCEDYSLVKKTCEWNVYQMDNSYPEFHQAKFLKNDHKQTDITYIYVCIEDETVGLSSALSLLDQTQSSDIPILVRMTEDTGLASLLKAAKAGLNWMHVFGLMERTCKPSLLNDGSHAARRGRSMRNTCGTRSAKGTA